MSKKVLMLSVAVLFGMQAGLAMAANPDTGPGCGLGKLAWSDFSHQKNIAPQVLMATTNGTFGSQTFGITSGTSNCGSGLMAQGTKNFVEANREALAKDISRGQGESIGALTVINACEDSRKVGTALKASFGRIFPNDQVSNEEVTKAILQTLQSDASLGCFHRS
jgi:Protein of unknown function (DUF3015)